MSFQGYREVASIETITPEMAKKIFDNNLPGNRHVSDPFVQKYANKMKEEKWELNGESIKISADGRLLDGQHRLLACVRSGKPFTTVIIRGLPSSAFSTIDIGRRRSVAQILRQSGFHSTSLMAAGINWIKALKSGKAQMVHASVTPQEAIDFVTANPQMQISASFVHNLSALCKLARPGLLGALHFLFVTKGGQHDANKFFLDLEMGNNLAAADPTLTLKQRLIEQIGSKSAREANNVVIACWFINAWNARRKGRPLFILKGPVTDVNGVEQYPDIA